MRWLYKLEYKYGRHYIRNLMTIVVAGMVVVYLLDMFAQPAGMRVSSYLTLNRSAIINQFQIWRVITFIFVPPGNQGFFLLISLYFYYIMGNMLEQYWGGFRLNVYYLFGMLGAIIATFIVGFGTNTYLNLTLFLAVATIAPDTQFMLFFIVPVKAKWLAIAYAGMIAIQLVFQIIANPISGLYSLVFLLFSIANYFLFFGRNLISGIQENIRIQRNRRNWQNRNR